MGKRPGKSGKKSAKDVEKRGIDIFDQSARQFIKFEDYLDRFTPQNQTPILENIYDTIASEFSKVDLVLSRKERVTDSGEAVPYERIDSGKLYELLTLRPNPLQTISEMLYTVAYQLHAYRNALVRIIRDSAADRNIVTALEPLNVDDYEFGQGYEIGNTALLKLRQKQTGQEFLIDYGDVIHLRLNPNDIFYGDRNTKFDLTHFVKVFDANLSAVLNELKNSGRVRGIIELGGPIGGGFGVALTNQGSKVSKQKEILDRIKSTDGGVLVLDSGEKWVSLNQPFETMGVDEVNSLMSQLYGFKGIKHGASRPVSTHFSARHRPAESIPRPR